MTVEEAITLVEQLLPGTRLTKVQEIVFRQCWAGQTYSDIAFESDYDLGYIKDVGSELWRSLSQALGKKVTKKNLYTVLKQAAQQNSNNPSSSLQFHSLANYTDWGEAIDVSQFYGRTHDLATLSRWVLQDNCRVVSLLGMGGIGKTALSVKLAQQLQGQFEYVIWRSLRHAPSFSDKLTECVKILSNQQVTTLPASPHEQITCLIEYLRKSRCLLILDNFDTLLQDGKRAGSYRQGYEPYGELLWRLGETQHQSCVLITSREKPAQIAALEGDALPVRTLALSGLEVAAGQTILTLKGLLGSEDQTRQLVECYGGNPLALKIAATSIRDLHEGSIANFLSEGTTVFQGIGHLLEDQFQRLSTLEQQLMYWLAINREKVSPAKLQTAFTSPLSKPKLIETLESLRWRSLIESNSGQFTQQPVVMEYVTDSLVEQICQEIITESPQYLLTHALMQAQAKDYIRDSQIHLVVCPILKQLQITLGSVHQLELKLGRLIRKLQNRAVEAVGYGGGNLLNLLAQLETDLTGYDFSGLDMRECDLRTVNLHEVNFTQTTFRDCVFAATFGGITSVAFSRDGCQLATSDTSGVINIWDVGNGKQLFNCQQHNSWIWDVAFSPVAPVLVSCGQDHTVKLWNTTTGQCFNTLHGHTSIVTSVAFSPQGRLLASSSYDHSVKVWDLDTGECIQTFSGHDACVWSVVFHPVEQILATAGEDNTIKLWELQSGCCLKTLQGHQHWVKTIAFNSGGRILASGSFDQNVKLWDTHTGKCVMTLQGHTGVVTSVAFNPKDNLLLSGSYDQSVKVWDRKTGKCLDTLKKHTNRIWSVAFHPQGHLFVSGGDDHAAKIWELGTGQCIKTFQGHSNATYAIAHNWEHSLLASGHEDQTIKLWDLNLYSPHKSNVNTHPFRILQGHSNRVFSVVFSSTGQLLASGSADRTIKLWSSHTGQCLQTLHGHDSWVWAIAFSPDDKLLASGSYDHTVKIWDVSSGECLQTLQGHPGSVLAVAFSCDGKTLFSSGYEKLVKQWDVETGDCLQTWEADSNRVWAVAVNGDNQYLTTGGDDSVVRLWDIHTGVCVRTFSGHTSQVICILFTKDSRRIISSSSDRTIKIWNITTGDCLVTLQAHDHWVWSLYLTPDEKTLLSGSWDETIKCWDISTGECWQTLRPARPYEGMIINGVVGLNPAQIATLKALGALEVN
ncbi:WD-repeat protein (plasmid) [Nostoc sp. NIES-2111]|nr:WD-repeat protein [Nostoc sp. NIES-2111]